MTKKEDPTLRPFEWLTSPASLKPILNDVLAKLRTEPQEEDDVNKQYDDGSHDPNTHHPMIRALHVGCGSSTVGEYLVTEFKCQQVVNVDVDEEILEQMKERWRNRQYTKKEDDEEEEEKDPQLNTKDRLEFCHCNLSNERLPYPSGSFDLVLDKSTLDVTLCSDHATAGLLCEVYRSLKKGGVYMIISFHQEAFLRPLLMDCPGTNWTVTIQRMERQVESLVKTHHEPSFHTCSARNETVDTTAAAAAAAAWSSCTGEFAPMKTTGAPSMSWSVAKMTLTTCALNWTGRPSKSTCTAPMMSGFKRPIRC